MGIMKPNSKLLSLMGMHEFMSKMAKLIASENVAFN